MGRDGVDRHIRLIGDVLAGGVVLQAGQDYLFLPAKTDVEELAASQVTARYS